jgi:isochorismate pyruvate lyase
MDLNEIRQRIDQIDSDIITLLSLRAGLVSTAGKLKNDEQGVRDPKRVEQVIGKVRAKAASSGLSPEIAERVYRTVIECFIDKELLEFNELIETREKEV